MRMFLKRMTQKTHTPGEDRVVAAISLPSDCMLRNVWMNFHYVGAQTEFNQAVMYALTGYILPVTDPDAANQFNTIWDQQVPKDLERSAGAGLDLDGAGIDSTNEFEPGEMNAQNLFDLGRRPEQIFRRRKMLSFAVSPHGFRDGTPKTYIPIDNFTTQLKKTYRTSVPSIVAFALSSPMLTDTISAPNIPLLESGWAMIKYAELLLENAMMDMLGLIETGAETPFEDAAAVLAGYVEPDVEEDDGGSWAQSDGFTFVDTTFEIWVPGQLGKVVVSSGL